MLFSDLILWNAIEHVEEGLLIKFLKTLLRTLSEEDVTCLNSSIKRLAEEVTVMVHSQEALDAAIEASNLLFGKSTKEGLEKLDEQTFLDVFDGVPQFEIGKDQLGQPAIELLTTVAPVFPSKGEMRKMVQGGGVSLNKEKITDQNRPITAEDLIDGKYLLAQKGKKNYYLLIVK